MTPASEVLGVFLVFTRKPSKKEPRKHLVDHGSVDALELQGRCRASLGPLGWMLISATVLQDFQARPRHADWTSNVGGLGGPSALPYLRRPSGPCSSPEGV